jgi:hypothetical protein
MTEDALIQQKLNEYRAMLAPLESAEKDITLARRMLHARTEEELYQIAPVLGALSDVLNISALDMLLAQDRVAFVREAMASAGIPAEEVRRKLVEASSTAKEDLKLLGFGESL